MDFSKTKNLLAYRLMSFLLILVILVSAVMPQNAYAESTVRVKYNGTIYSYNSSGGKPAENMHGKFSTNTFNGMTYCAEHGLPTPMSESVGATATLNAEAYSSIKIGKILYYGYGGPGEWSGFSSSKYNGVYQVGFAGNASSGKTESCGIAVTAMALTKAYGADGRWYNVSGLDEFLEYIERKETPPSGFKIYRLYDNKSSTQDLFTWNYEPQGKLTLIKKVTEDTGISIKGAVYGVYTKSSCISASKVGTLTTNADGTANTLTLPVDTYYVKEISAPDGWQIDTQVHSITVKEDQTVKVTSTEEPEYGYLTLLKKVSVDTGDSIRGAVYGVYTKSSCIASSKVGELTTKADGTANTLKLLPGAYYVKEISAPEGWELDTKVHEVTVKALKTATVTSTEKPEYGYLTLLKEIEKNNGYSIKGAVYGVYTKSSCTASSKAGELTTKADGTANTLKLLPGTYYVKEISAPEGWELDEKVYSVTVSANKTIKVTSVEKPKKGRVSLVKKVASNDHLVEACPELYSIAGAEYGVYTTKDAAEDDVKSKKVGILTVKENGTTNEISLDPGTYYIKETSAPDGFKLDTKVHTVVVESLKEAVVNSKEEPAFESMNLLLTKVDDENKPLKGAVFQVEYYKTLGSINDTKPAKIWEFTTDSKGQIALSDNYRTGGDKLYKDDEGNPVGLIGTYVFKEVKAPTGYIKLETSITKKITQNSITGETLYNDPTVTNTPQTVSITVKKVDAETGKASPQGYGSFEGAQYTVTQYNEATEKDEVVGTITLNSSGKGSLKGLIPGEYKVYESKAPSGYVKNPEVMTVRAAIKNASDANFDYVVESKETPTTTVFSKYIEGTKNYLAGAVLAVYDSDGNEIERWTTTKKAHEIKGLAAGTYTLKELSAPLGYLKAEDITFTVKTNTAYTEVVMEDDYTKSEIIKIDANTGRALEGVTLQLMDSKGTVVDKWITTSKAHRIDKIAAGTYTLKEVATLPGYILADDMEVTIKAVSNIQSITMKNDFTKVQIAKIDIVTGEPVVGAVLKILDSDGKEVTSWISGEEPHYIERLDEGEYTLIETYAPGENGYVTAQDVKFIVKDTSEIQKVTMEDDHTKIVINKVDMETKNPIPDTVISLIPISDEGELLEGETFLTDITDENGQIKAEYVPIGKYAVKESGTNFNLGYVTAEDMIIEVVDTPNEQVFTMEDDHTKIEITKTDIVTGEPVIGAKLQILDSEGKVVTSWTSDKEPYHIEYLPTGDYTLVETYAPGENGYVTAENIKFTVKDTGEIQQVNMKDDFTKVELHKVDSETKEFVIGAKLQLLDEKGNIVDEWKTEDEAHYMERLPVGTYVLREVSAPDGYNVAEDIMFEVTDSSEVQNVTMEDTAIAEVPAETGDNITIFPFIIAAVFTLLCTVALKKTNE